MRGNRPFLERRRRRAHRAIPLGDATVGGIDRGREGRGALQNSPALCLLTAVFFAWQTAPHRSTGEMQVKNLKVNDVELAYAEEGKGDAEFMAPWATGARGKICARSFLRDTTTSR